MAKFSYTGYWSGSTSGSNWVTNQKPTLVYWLHYNGQSPDMIDEIVEYHTVTTYLNNSVSNWNYGFDTTNNNSGSGSTGSYSYQSQYGLMNLNTTALIQYAEGATTETVYTTYWKRLKPATLANIGTSRITMRVYNPNRCTVKCRLYYYQFGASDPTRIGVSYWMENIGTYTISSLSSVDVDISWAEVYNYIYCETTQTSTSNMYPTSTGLSSTVLMAYYSAK